jgi:hypothetical protein
MSNAGNKRKLGCISFGYIFFVQAKKSNSPRGEIKCRNKALAHPKSYRLELQRLCITHSTQSASFGNQRKITRRVAKEIAQKNSNSLTKTEIHYLSSANDLLTFLRLDPQLISKHENADSLFGIIARWLTNN